MTDNTANPTRTTVKVRTVSGAEHILSTPRGESRTVSSFEYSLHNCRTNPLSSGFIELSLIDGSTIHLNPEAVESFQTVPVPRRTSADIRRGTITYGAYVDEDPEA